MTHQNLVILTGAGISAESGLGTFRDKDGIWTRYDLEDVATPQGYARNPTLVHEFYNKRRQDLVNATPNAAHLALADLQERAKPKSANVMIVTQNVDDLHEKAGASDIVHMHGELNSALCGNCGWRGHWPVDMEPDTLCLQCSSRGFVRPDVVWFGEMPYHMDKIYDALSKCDLFVSIGTSGAVYPAADFVREARLIGAQTIELNLEPSENAHVFDDAVYGAASEIVPEWVNSLFE